MKNIQETNTIVLYVDYIHHINLRSYLLNYSFSDKLLCSTGLSATILRTRSQSTTSEKHFNMFGRLLLFGFVAVVFAQDIVSFLSESYNYKYL